MNRSGNTSHVLPALLVAVAMVLVSAAAPAAALPSRATPYWIDGSERFHEQGLRAAEMYPLRPLPREELVARGRMDPSGRVVVPERGQRTVFTSINFVSMTAEPVTATLRAVGDHCYVYVADGYTIDASVIKRVQTEFDRTIHPRVTGFFGSEWNPGIDHDPHVTLLLLDIKDGWTPGRGYIAGYFMPLDEYSSRLFSFSNEREMLYLDLFPARPDSRDFLSTLAHEFCHMVHFNQDRKEGKWLNEGLAQLASHVAGFGHPGQIFSFFANPTGAALDSWTSSIEDYGGSYLWFYYVYSKVAGKTDAERSAFFKDLIASKDRGLDSFKNVLAKHHPDVALDKLFADWTIATFANLRGVGDGRWGYDDTMPLVACEGATHQDLSRPVKGKGKLSGWCSSSILFTPQELWSPRRPNFTDEIRIYSDQPGSVRWTVNEGVLPPEELIPAGSAVADDGAAVVTPLAGPDAQQRYSAVLGPMMSRELKITSVRYSLAGAKRNSAMRVIPVGHLPQPDDDGASRADRGRRASPASGMMRLEFDGASLPFGIGNKKYMLRAVIEDIDGGVKVEEPRLNGSNSGSFTFATDWSRVKAVTVLPVNVGGPDAKYSYRTRPEAGGQANGDGGGNGPVTPPAGLPNADEIRRAIKDNPVPLELSLVGSDNPLYKETLANLSRDPKALGWFVDVTGRLDPVQQGSLRGFLRDLLRAVQDQISSGTLTVDPVVVEMLKKVLREVVDDGAGGGDTAHSNLPYLVSKARELIRALSHVQIDPFGFEGVILNALHVFRALGTIPNIPLPEGLSPVRYKMAKATELMDAWSQPGADSRLEEERRQTIYRLILASGMVEFSHNVGLLMADDLLVALYRLVMFADSARTVTDILAIKASGIPIVGPLLAKIKWIISSQILSIVARLTRYVAERLPEPYGSIVQYVSQILFWGYAQAKRLSLDYWDSWVIEYVVKMVGKLVIVSIPKIGYVAVGQPAVNVSVDLASRLVHQGTLAQAQVKLATVYQEMAREVVRRHKLAINELHAADIMGRISDVTRLGILLDPTKITTIVSIATSIITGGILVHSMYMTGRYFYALPLKHLRDAVKSVFYPLSVPADLTFSSVGAGGPAAPARRAHGLHAATAARLATGWQKAADEAREILGRYQGEAAARRVDMRELERDVNRLVELEPAFFEAAHALDSVGLAEGRAAAGSPESQTTAVSADTGPTPDEAAFAADLQGDLSRVSGLAALATLPLASRDEASLKEATRALKDALAGVDRLAGRLGRLSGAAQPAALPAGVLVLHDLTVTDRERAKLVRFQVTNPLADSVAGVRVDLETAYGLAVTPGRTVALGALAPGESRTVELTVDASSEPNTPAFARLLARGEGGEQGELTLVVNK
jgi:hypothetical protein